MIFANPILAGRRAPLCRDHKRGRAVTRGSRSDARRTVLVECWAHQGPPKAAQKHKVLADALKLTWIASTLYPRPQLILCLSDPQAAAPFQPGARSWAAQALQDLGIRIEIVDLPDDIRESVVSAQHRQYR